MASTTEASQLASLGLLTLGKQHRVMLGWRAWKETDLALPLNTTASQLWDLGLCHCSAKYHLKVQCED